MFLQRSGTVTENHGTQTKDVLRPWRESWRLMHRVVTIVKIQYHILEICLKDFKRCHHRKEGGKEGKKEQRE